MALEELIEIYEIKIKHLDGMIEAAESQWRVARLTQKRACYRTFVVDLQRVNFEE